MSWDAEDVDTRLAAIMKDIHRKCRQWGTGEDGQIDYVRGANLAGFVKVANAMLAYGGVQLLPRVRRRS